MGRSAIVPSRILDADHITAGVTSEPASGIETRPTSPASANVGKMDLVPSGTPDEAVDLDVYMRTAGNVDGARFGHRDDEDIFGYKGKTPAIPYDVEFLEYGTVSAARPQRIKALPLDSGELLLVVLRHDDSLAYYTWQETTGWSAATTITTGVTFAQIDGMDVVQTTDTKEIILIVLGDDGTNRILSRMVSAGDTSASIAWRVTPVETPQTDPLISATAIGMEMLSSGRIAMLMHAHGLTPAIWRTFSDDRGVTWAQWALASNYPELEIASVAKLGGVGMTKTRTGALMATVGVGSTDTTSPPSPKPWFEIPPATLTLVSDDGDTWGSVIRNTPPDAAGLGIAGSFGVLDWPLFNGGMVEACPVVGDDGFPRVIGCLHGDSVAVSGGLTNSTIYDDFAIFAFRKQDITGADVGPQIPTGTDFSGIGWGSNFAPTCTDAIESTVDPTIGLRVPTEAEMTAHRFAALDGSPSGNVDVTPVYQGPRFVEAVNFRGAIWVFAGFEDTTNTQYSLGTFRINAWSTLNERLGDVTLDTDVLRGYTYTEGWMAWTTPDLAGLAQAGAGTDVLDAATGGLLITAVANSRHFGFGVPGGTKGRPFFVRGKVKPTSGGSTTVDTIAVQIVLEDAGAANETDVSIRFLDTGIVVYDNVATAAITTVGGLSIGTLGVEFVIAYSAWDTFIGAFYRAITTDPEDGFWQEIPLTNPATQGGGGESVKFGALAGASTSVATWYNVLLGRGSATSPNDNGVALNGFDGTEAWDAGTPTFSEFVDDIVPYDDLLRHGCRAPRCNSAAMYLRKNLKAVWRGGAGVEGDEWDILTKNQYSVERVIKVPVGDLWRSEDDSAITNITFNAGNDERWNVDAIALFRCNLKQFKVQFDTAPTFDSGGPGPSHEIDVDCAESGDVRREYVRYATADYTIAGADSREIVLGAATQPLQPHQFRSDDRMTWYAWSNTLSKSFKIIDNDGWTIFFDEGMTGVDAGAGYLRVFPDRIGLDVSGGNLGSGGGYQYMRINIPVQVLSETFYQIGMIIAGQKFDLTDPHPEWGWMRKAQAPVTTVPLRGGGSVTHQRTDAALTRYEFGFSGLRDRPGRADIDTTPGDRGGYMKLMDFLSAVKWGEKIIALFPEYNDGRDVSSWFRTHEVLPCRVFGPWTGAHATYEFRNTNCGGGAEGTVKAVLDVDNIAFDEIL